MSLGTRFTKILNSYKKTQKQLNTLKNDCFKEEEYHQKTIIAAEENIQDVRIVKEQVEHSLKAINNILGEK